MSQEQGLVGKLVGKMIRRSVRTRFHSVYWDPIAPPKAPAIFYANHHGWMDGYLMFHVVSELDVRCLDWIEEFDSFPLFARIGGMKFDKASPQSRAATIRKTIREMNRGTSLVIFPEGILHRPPDLLPFGRSLEVIAKKVPNLTMIPVGIHYELSLHERPEAWISLGSAHPFESLRDCENRVTHQLQTLRSAIAKGQEFPKLVAGTRDINERMSMKKVKA